MKVISISFAILILSFQKSSYAQDTARIKTTRIKSALYGKVINSQTNEPLHGASVYFPDLKIGGATNDEGVFNLKNVPIGSYLLEVSFLGFTSVLQTQTIGGNTEENFALTPTYIETEGVTVTGVSTATSIKRTPVPVSIVKRDDLLREATTNLIDAISKQPGVAQISTGPAISKPVIRGLGYNRVVVINDGVRQEGQQWGDEHGIEVDEYSVNKAEILKGPASLMYGSDAIAGVINFISLVPALQNTIKGSLLTTYQTNNRQRGYNGNVSGNQNGLIWGMYGSYRAAGDYKNKYDGFVFNSKFNERNFGGHLGLNKSWGYTHLLVSNFNQYVGLVEGERDSATGKFLKRVNNNGVENLVIANTRDFKSSDPYTPRQRVQHFKVTADNSYKIGKDRLTFLLGYQRNQRQEFGNIIEPGQKELYFDLKSLSYNLQYHLDPSHNWKTTLGVNGMKQTNTNRGVEYLIPDYSIFDIGGFVYTQRRLEKLTISGGVRYDNRNLHSKQLIEGGNIKFEVIKKNFSNSSFSGGLSYEAGKTVTLKLNAARGFRAPSIPELASNGAHEGTNRYEYGTADLKSETSFQVDAGIEIGTEHVSLSANLFFNSVKNFIYYRKLSSVTGTDSILTDGLNNFLAFNFDQRNARLYGFEANFDLHPHPLDWLHIENTFSYVRGILSEEQDGSNNLPFVPAPRLINELKVELLKRKQAIHNLYAKLELDNTFTQQHPFTGFNTETATQGYTLLNAGFGGEVSNKGKHLFSLFFSANNINNVAYQNHLSRLKYAAVNNVSSRQGVYNTGRNFSVKLNIPLDYSTK